MSYAALAPTVDGEQSLAAVLALRSLAALCGSDCVPVATALTFLGRLFEGEGVGGDGRVGRGAGSHRGTRLRTLDSVVHEELVGFYTRLARADTVEGEYIEEYIKIYDSNRYIHMHIHKNIMKIPAPMLTHLRKCMHTLNKIVAVHPRRNILAHPIISRRE